MVMMSELPGLGLSLAVGMALGGVFFGGLWWTLVRLPTTRWPIPLALGSLTGRTGFTVIGFYLVTDGSLARLLICLLGFILMRHLLIRRLGSVPVPVEQP
jgi:F1F0 ATPase subunit 2